MYCTQGVCSAVYCYFRPFLTPHFTVWFNQNHNYTILHFYSHMYSAVYKMQFECFETNIFFEFQAFPTQSKIDFSLCFGPSFKLLDQFFFILGWLSQSTLVRVIKIFFFFWKTRFTILLIIYLILKNNYINIYRKWWGMMWFVQFFYYKTTNCTAPCSAVYC